VTDIPARGQDLDNQAVLFKMIPEIIERQDQKSVKILSTGKTNLYLTGSGKLKPDKNL